MPSTLTEIARECGVTKQTVKNNLRSMGLWDFHVTHGDVSTPSVVDDEATRQVVAVLTSRRRPTTAPPTTDEAEARARLYEDTIADLRREVAELRAERDRYKAESEEKAERIRALKSPDDVERAREDGERDGREAGIAEERQRAEERAAKAREEADKRVEDAVKDAKKQATMEERQRIAGLHWWERTARRLMRQKPQEG